MNIGRAISLCRSAKKISLDDLSQRTELSAAYLSMIENGKRTPTLPSIEKICTALEIPTPIVLFLAAEKDELKGLDSETSSRLSASVLAIMRA
jgi:transcriptional regulator with XRE-family HTH domain